ncbi:MAG: phosphatidylglycerophosphatase A [Gammaproteobacteria bacterium]|nr:phosphatidylglycerophosphatase A [Gammaproteobacteria bacterium]
MGRNPTISDLKHPWMFLALGAGSGLAPKAPGTFGTAAFLLVAPWFVAWSLPLQLVCVLVLCVLGTLAADRATKRLGVHDHGAIVIDEWAGMAIALMAATSAFEIAVAFVAFRIFDIIKPPPIGWVDQRVQGGLGIMLDDLIAGVFALPVVMLASGIF